MSEVESMNESEGRRRDRIAEHEARIDRQIERCGDFASDLGVLLVKHGLSGVRPVLPECPSDPDACARAAVANQMLRDILESCAGTMEAMADTMKSNSERYGKVASVMFLAYENGVAHTEAP